MTTLSLALDADKREESIPLESSLCFSFRIPNSKQGTKRSALCRHTDDVRLDYDVSIASSSAVGVNPTAIPSRDLQAEIPAIASPKKWTRIVRAIEYGKMQVPPVNIIITVTK